MKTLKTIGYNRQATSAGIAHIGVGNFHRAHEEYYTNLILADEDQANWGICGIALLPSDEALVKALRSQNCQYTLTVCGRNGQDELLQIGSLVELLWGMESIEAVIAKLADPAIKIISLTITEGGYNLDKSTGEFIIDNELVQHDLNSANTPKSVFGIVAAALRVRMANNNPVTILSCDNLQHNGNTTKRAFSSFFKAQDAALASWVGHNVTFPNSMVDRITPAVTKADRDRLNSENGTDDAAPVYCEDFIQWVIEDNFIASRPAWERAGVEFTDDVTAYENMKLSLLNASHTMLSYPAFLSGYRKVDDAMHDPIISKFLRDYMDIDITPFVPAPGSTDLELYKQTLIERFGNRCVSDQIARLCFDGVSKIPVYIMPNLGNMINANAELKRVTYMVAVYRKYLQGTVDDKGVSYSVDEPWLTATDKEIIASTDPVKFLELSPFAAIKLSDSPLFVESYLQMVAAVNEQGCYKVLESIV